MDRHTIERMPSQLPLEISDLEAGGPLTVAELWSLARFYSRLRNRSSATKKPRDRERYEAMKFHCVREVIARERGLFLIFLDPESPHLWIIYHRIEQNLLHILVAIGIERPTLAFADQREVSYSSEGGEHSPSFLRSYP